MVLHKKPFLTQYVKIYKIIHVYYSSKKVMKLEIYMNLEVNFFFTLKHFKKNPYERERVREINPNK